MFSRYFFDLIMIFMYLMFILVVLTFISARKHLLLTLLSLEFLVLIVFTSLCFSLMFFSNEFYILLVFLTFTVCEGAIGLGVLVSLIRCHGNDNIYSLTFLLW